MKWYKIIVVGVFMATLCSCRYEEWWCVDTKVDEINLSQWNDLGVLWDYYGCCDDRVVGASGDSLKVVAYTYLYWHTFSTEPRFHGENVYFLIVSVDRLDSMYLYDPGNGVNLYTKPMTVKVLNYEDHPFLDSLMTYSDTLYSNDRGSDVAVCFADTLFIRGVMRDHEWLMSNSSSKGSMPGIASKDQGPCVLHEAAIVADARDIVVHPYRP